MRVSTVNHFIIYFLLKNNCYLYLYSYAENYMVIVGENDPDKDITAQRIAIRRFLSHPEYQSYK